MRHEWRALVADRAVVTLLVVLAGALAWGLFNGVRWQGYQGQVIADALREEQARFARAEETIAAARARKATLPAFSDPGNPDTAGRNFAARYVTLPPSALMPLAVGQSDLLPGYFKITTDAEQTVLATSDTVNPLQLLTGRLDVAFVLIYLYPLFLLAISYNLLSGEREQGTLALTLSQPIALRQLLAGKVAIRLVVVLGCVAATLTVGCLAVGVRLWDPAVLLSFAGWLAVVAAYGVFWMAVAVAVALGGWSSAASAVVLAGTWLALTVLVPSAAQLALDSLYPVPSRVEMIQAMREASDAANADGAALLGRYYQDHPELATDGSPAADFNVTRLAVDARIEESVAPVLARFERQLAAQRALAGRVRLLSPAILAQDALVDLAGTGAPRHEWFVAQVRRFHRQWRQFFFPRVAARTPLVDYAAVPRFTFAEEPAQARGRRVLVAVAIVGVHTLLALAAAVAASRRLELASS